MNYKHVAAEMRYDGMDKNLFAVTPPMGWNSYDYYDTGVTEEQVKANADYMAKHLKQYGWEYIVVDIEWYSYDAGSQRDRYQYIPFWDVAMDEYSRLLPCEQRFPSAAGGKGFAPLAQYVHDLGLKFGIHIMRGIPRNAVHAHAKILHSTHTANEIAQPNNICEWNPDMYGIDPVAEGAQEYYDSLLALYAQWGVDFIKCDDICRMDMPTAKEEIRMLSEAIEKCGRPIVLSLSPGPAKIEEAWYYETHANMWRITDDFWDDWQLLVPMFERMGELAAILRKKRFQRGSIDFDFPETKIILDKDGHPLEVKPYDRNVATKIIEEFMLIANETVAEDYFWQEIPFLYR